MLSVDVSRALCLYCPASFAHPPTPALCYALPQCPAHVVVVVGRVVAPTPPPCTRSVGSMRTGPRPAGDATWRHCSGPRWKSCSRGHLRRCGDGWLCDAELAACSVCWGVGTRVGWVGVVPCVFFTMIIIFTTNSPILPPNLILYLGLCSCCAYGVRST